MNPVRSLYQVVREAEEDTPDKEEFEDLSSDDGEESTDYTADTEKTDDTDSPDTGDEEDTDSPDGDTSTDYTVDSEESDGDTSDDADADTNTDEESETPPAESESDLELNRELLSDFISLHGLCGSTTARLSQVDKSNIIINQIVARVTSNINQIEKHLYEFIVFKFGKGKYPYNLYKYNQFVEAFRINVEMLKKINVFTSNSQNN